MTSCYNGYKFAHSGVRLQAGTHTVLPTLLHTPLELVVQFVEQDGVEDIVVLREHVHDGVQGVVTRGRHPLRLLQQPCTHKGVPLCYVMSTSRWICATGRLDPSLYLCIDV